MGWLFPQIKFRHRSGTGTGSVRACEQAGMAIEPKTSLNSREERKGEGRGRSECPMSGGRRPACRRGEIS